MFITFKNIVRKYGDVLACNDISFDIEEHQIVGLLGRNGAGKTTLLSLLSKEIIQNSGEIHIAGKPLAASGINLCIVQQELGLFDFLTVKDHFRYFSILRSSPRKPVSKETVGKVISDMKLHPLLNKKALHLSGGEKRRVMLALALIADPEVLILDEPTANLDIEWQIYLLDYIYSLNKDKGKTIIYSSHNLNEVEKITDKVIILENGKLVADSSIDQIITSLPYTLKIKLNPAAMMKLPESAFSTLSKDVYIYSSAREILLYFNADRRSKVESILGGMGLLYAYEPINIDDFFKLDTRK